MKDSRVVVIMPEAMLEFLKRKARESGVGNVSAYIRLMISLQMEEERKAATNGA